MSLEFMMARRGAMGLLVVAAGVLAGCGLFNSSASFRYRMKVEGSHPGEAVYEILAEKVSGPRLPDERPGGSIIKGEALVIETPSGPVFLLLQSPGSGGDLKGAVARTLAPDIPWNGQPNFWKAVTRLADAGEGEAKGELPREDWPMMVRFRDINDPKSVELVDPEAVGVKRIMIETTSDDVTTGIEMRLGWLPKQKGSFVRRLSVADPTNPPIAAILNKQDFSTEIGK